MTIDEAIKHAKENAEKKFAEGMLCHANPNDEFLDKCIDCAKEHLQLAEWLEELKAIRQWKSDIMEDFCRYDVNSFEELVVNVRTKVIDEFYGEILNFEDYIEPIDTSKFGAVLLYSGKDITNMIVKIKEQLKEGDSNGT